jgi:hypothetical protein
MPLNGPLSPTLSPSEGERERLRSGSFHSPFSEKRLRDNSGEIDKVDFLRSLTSIYGH